MKHSDELLLQALNASLRNSTVSWEESLPAETWLALFQASQAHHILPLVFQAVYGCPAARSIPEQQFQNYQRNTVRQVATQAVKTREALRLLQHLRDAGVAPLVVKGMICRELYPDPDCRASTDEDILIPPQQFSLCHKAMLSFGMVPVNPVTDLDAAYEIPYRKADSPLYIELHKSLFPGDSTAYGDLNRFFQNVSGSCTTVNIQGVPVSTLCPTDHLFYLICHAFKHFLHSGFGLRQVCDIVLFANAHGSQIDWHSLLDRCTEIRASLFAASIFKIGRVYLNFSPELACFPPAWRHIAVDEVPMLEDLLQAGIYGSADAERLHSSNITLNAVAAQKRGTGTRGSLLSVLFPPFKTMAARYPYVNAHPVLLPVAWADRILQYRRESGGNLRSRASASVQIGARRIALLEQYGIIDSRR